MIKFEKKTNIFVRYEEIVKNGTIGHLYHGFHSQN